MKKFLKNNKYILGFLVASLVYSISFVVKTDKETISSMLYAVALSYIAAFIFYLLQIYYPGKERQKVVNRIITSRLNNIVYKIEELCKEVAKLYIANYGNTISPEIYMKNKFKCNYKDRALKLDLGRAGDPNIDTNSYCKTLGELAMETIRAIKDNTEFLYKTFPDDLTSDIINILENISHSMLMQFVPLQLVTPLNCDLPDESIYAGICSLNNELKSAVEDIKSNEKDAKVS